MISHMSRFTLMQFQHVYFSFYRYWTVICSFPSPWDARGLTMMGDVDEVEKGVNHTDIILRRLASASICFGTQLHSKLSNHLPLSRIPRGGGVGGGVVFLLIQISQTNIGFRGIDNQLYLHDICMCLFLHALNSTLNGIGTKHRWIYSMCE